MLNQIVLIGRLVNDIELKALPSGKEVTSFSLAVQRNFKNQEGEYDTDFINCVAFGNTAKLMDKYCFKGQLINIVGRLQVRSWELDNGKRYVTEVIVNSFEILEWKKTETTQSEVKINQQPNIQINEDDLPF